MGFSKDGKMVGSSAMVGWLNRKGRARVKQYYLQGSKEWDVIPDKGELPLTGVPSSVVIHGATIYLAFQLKFQTHLARQPIILAFGTAYPKHSGHLPKHEDKTTVTFDFSAGLSSLSLFFLLLFHFLCSLNVLFMFVISSRVGHFLESNPFN
jgi:hypothetical protein